MFRTPWLLDLCSCMKDEYKPHNTITFSGIIPLPPLVPLTQNPKSVETTTVECDGFKAHAIRNINGNLNDQITKILIVSKFPKYRFDEVTALGAPDGSKDPPSSSKEITNVAVNMGFSSLVPPSKDTCCFSLKPHLIILYASKDTGFVEVSFKMSRLDS